MSTTATWDRIDEPTARDKLFDQLTGKPALQVIPDFEPATLTLDGKRMDARIEGAVTAGELVRSIEGASTLTLTLSDDVRALLRSGIFLDEENKLAPLVVRLPGPKRNLAFSLAQLGKSGDELTLTFEDREIAKLRRFTKPRKADRANTTRAEFIGMLAREAKVRYKSPELHKAQPIGHHKAASTKTTKTPTEEKSKGGLPAHGLTVKGVAMSAEQRRVAEQMLAVAVSKKAPKVAMVAMIIAGINESTLHNLTGGDSSSVGVLQLLDIHLGGSTSTHGGRRDVARVSEMFLTAGFTGKGGAISLAKKNPSWSPGQIAQAVQGAGVGYGDNWAAEARKIVNAYGGDSGGSVETTTTSTVVKPYFFQRGEGKKRESSWTAIKRLADEVGWRAFMIEGVLWYVSEEDLFLAAPKMLITEASPGVDVIDFDWDTGKKVAQATVTCRVDAWQADPGSVIALKDCGPADGSWLVESITRGLWDAAAEITLRKPMQDKSEPANETRTRTQSFGGERGTSDAPSSRAGTGGAADMVAWAKAKLGTAEGSAGQRRFAADIGYSASDPWCSIFIAYGIKHIAHLPLPSGVGMAQAWLGWSGGRRVGLSDLKAGDIVVFDWGDGGVADHVALYIGGGHVIGGNQSNNVTNVPFQRGSCIGAMRPKYRS